MTEQVPLGIKDTKYIIPVSLRGSLADQYCRLISNRTAREAEDFLKRILCSTDERLLKIFDEEKILVGLTNERGMYFPDW